MAKMAEKPYIPFGAPHTYETHIREYPPTTPPPPPPRGWQPEGRNHRKVSIPEAMFTVRFSSCVYQ